MSNIITKNNCKILVDGVNLSFFPNTPEGRAQLLSSCQEMNLMSAYEEVMSVWGDDVPPLSLSDLKTSKLSELETSFDTRVSGSVTINPGDYLMQFDVTDSLKMQGAITLMETTGQTEGYLTQADDTTIYHVPLETMKAVLVEMLAAYAQCHARKQELRAQINEAQNVEDLNAIQITWPV